MGEYCKVGKKLLTKELKLFAAYYTHGKGWNQEEWEKLENARDDVKHHLKKCEQCRKAESEEK